ncbi:phosphatidate cytidylyltransferase [Vulgatibacter incomptus]|uniref:Phosphatidate cytidylyltransferase n=1 Tax=Vulgatibacter incomptus TaxID=1391653 RepID=A0A0K1PCU5_9BACT|nr:phosphatidate cytidylyltransferase [Vulgatibacter incomptus]AKU91363.1 Phosphatidate cytidylyltransferase [Vulgatibacter incomptus]
MNDKNRNLVLRVASALLLLPIVLGLLWLGGIAAILLVVFAIVMVASEFYKMAGVRASHPAAILGLVASASLAWIGASIDTRWPGALGVLVLVPLASVALYTLFPPDGDLRKAAASSGFVALMPGYAGLGLGAVVALRAMPGHAGITWTLVAIGVTWANDTGAYFAGRLFGRHKLYPLISPNKTWEGFVGGMASSVLICFLIKWIYAVEVLHFWDCVIVGVVGGVLGPLGDLSESMLKRAFGVKDSGRIMPGHGGIFDRVDALMFVAPWVFAYAHFIRTLA